jgi:hypothetical protein
MQEICPVRIVYELCMQGINPKGEEYDIEKK